MLCLVVPVSALLHKMNGKKRKIVRKENQPLIREGAVHDVRIHCCTVASSVRQKAEEAEAEEGTLYPKSVLCGLAWPRYFSISFSSCFCSSSSSSFKISLIAGSHSDLATHQQVSGLDSHFVKSFIYVLLDLLVSHVRLILVVGYLCLPFLPITCVLAKFL